MAKDPLLTVSLKKQSHEFRLTISPTGDDLFAGPAVHCVACEGDDSIDHRARYYHLLRHHFIR